MNSGSLLHQKFHEYYTIKSLWVVLMTIFEKWYGRVLILHNTNEYLLKILHNIYFSVKSSNRLFF